MNHSNKLNRALRDWAASQAAGDAQLQALRRTVVTAVQAEPVGTAYDAILPRTPLWRRSSVAFGLGAIAASLVLFVILWSTREIPTVTVPSEQQPASDVPPAFAWLAQSQLSDKKKLFLELERVFDGQAAWVAEQSGLVRIGVAPDDGFAPRDAQRLAIRLVVTRTTPASARPMPVWALDLLSVNEQFVRLDETAGDGQSRVNFWAYCLPDEGKVAVDGTIELDGAVRLQTSFTRIQELGTPQLVCTWTAGAAEYQMYQTVASLDDEVL